MSSSLCWVKFCEIRKQWMAHRGEGLPFNACLYFLKDFKPPLKSYTLHSCGSRISQLFQGMQSVCVVYNTRSAAFRPKKRPNSKQYCISLVLGSLQFLGRNSFYWPQAEFVPPPSISGENCWPYSCFFANNICSTTRIGVFSGMLIK